MSRGQHEAVPVRPDRILGVEAQEALPETVGDGRHRHRGPRMAGVRLLDGVHGERADGVDAQPVGPVLREGEVTGTGRRHTPFSTSISAEGAPCRMNDCHLRGASPVTRCSPFAPVVAIPSTPSGPVYLTGHTQAA